MGVCPEANDIGFPLGNSSVRALFKVNFVRVIAHCTEYFFLYNKSNEILSCCSLHFNAYPLIPHPQQALEDIVIPKLQAFAETRETVRRLAREMKRAFHFVYSFAVVDLFLFLIIPF